MYLLVLSTSLVVLKAMRFVNSPFSFYEPLTDQALSLWPIYLSILLLYSYLKAIIQKIYYHGSLLVMTLWMLVLNQVFIQRVPGLTPLFLRNGSHHLFDGLHFVGSWWYQGTTGSSFLNFKHDLGCLRLSCSTFRSLLIAFAALSHWYAAIEFPF